MKKKTALRFILPVIFILLLCACQKKTDLLAMEDNDGLNETDLIDVPNGAASDLSLSSRKDDDDCNTYYGPKVKMGNGKVRSWINISRHGKPLAIGVQMSKHALENLPTNPEDFNAATFVLALPAKALAVTPFNHITINWNIHGHEPPGVYDVPHFDFHFYKISVADQMAIPPYEVAPAGFDNLPSADYLPDLYLRVPGGVPAMGAHWVDLTSPELNGGKFTHTFIYGSYNGKVTFEEPMITLETLTGGSTIAKAIRQPAKFSPAGNYPSWYKIWKEDKKGRHYVALSNFVKRQ